ncbi:holo-[acyl-carrier-protein] synthase [Streptomyces triticagri]|uniref:Holo-[acyl-carrier-protein] synthase n=1 Tax=Streptomyces triticagri TaxID=2293568 RepID=A0A372M272_9ACTN|nr:holo-ACP synthase [Streptomyces triticagri]RFU84710.1 holo-[acyl-carrier-protein] synthase [Streptomyces triticagri]
MSAAAELTESLAAGITRRIADLGAAGSAFDGYLGEPAAADPAVVFAVGVDVVAVERIEAMVQRQGERLLARLLTPTERTWCAGRSGAHRARYVAGRVAAKEAVRKTFGGQGSGVGWREVEIRRGAAGEPLPVLSGRADEAFRLAGLRRLHLSISHDAGVAVAVALAG